MYKFSPVSLGKVVEEIKSNGSMNIGMLPSNMSPDNVWFKPMIVTVSSTEELGCAIASFEYYNCNDELGNEVILYEVIEC
jgi:hypothetical protein